MKAKPMKTYIQNGITITVYDYIKPRKTERTFPMIKGSIWNIGGQAARLSTMGLTKHKRG